MDAAPDLQARTAHAQRLLIGKDAPFEPKEAVRMLSAAADEGGAEALAQMATLKGAGAWTVQSWPEAFDLLARAAASGSERAQQQLLVLAGDRELAARVRTGAADDGVWRGLSNSIDVAAWTTPPERRSICERPRIRAVEGFAPPEACDWLIQRGLGKFRPALMFDGHKSSFQESRTCSDFVFDLVEADLVLVLLRLKISAITRLPVEAMEPPQIFHYALGQEIKPHFDFLRDGDTPYGQDGAYKGDRIATFLLYLNDDYEGGELEFPRVGVVHRGRTGDGVYFAHVDETGKPDRISLHAALPITRGEKFILSQWIHDRPFTA